MPAGASPKREREYKELKSKFKKQKRYKGREEEVASRIVNKQRRKAGETKKPAKKSAPRKSTAKSRSAASRKVSSRKTAARKTPARKTAARKTTAKRRGASRSSR